MELPGYSNLTKLSKGGMGAVYRARQDSLDRIVAVKFLLAEKLWDEKSRAFFDKESLIIARLNHPNIIKIYDRGISDRGRPYFVMEYVTGVELGELPQIRKLTANARIQLMLQLCRGIAYAHKNGVIHRDIKPSNILVDEEGHLRILDFGIALLESEVEDEDSQIRGTMDYMSPEQFSNPSAVSYASDIYALGAVMFEFFTGLLPSENFNRLEECLDGLQPGLVSLIVSCLSESQEERPDSVDEVSFALLKALQGAHIRKDDREEASSTIGKLADKFELLDVVSKTSFSMVYLFHDKHRNKQIVVKKRVKSHLGFEQCTKLKQAGHEHIVRILGTSKNAKAFIVVMEYLTGGSLQDRLVRPLSLRRFLPVASLIAETLTFAHKQGVFHGDLRPSNILFDQKGRLKLSDFGFERHYSQQSEIDWYQPEKRNGLNATRDIFSAGAIFHQMLTGSPPLIKFGLLKNSAEFDRLDVGVQSLLRRMLEMQSLDRLESFEQVGEEIRVLQQEQPDEKRTPGQAFRFRWSYLWWLIAFNLVLGLVLLLSGVVG